MDDYYLFIVLCRRQTKSWLVLELPHPMTYGEAKVYAKEQESAGFLFFRAMYQDLRQPIS